MRREECEEEEGNENENEAQNAGCALFLSFSHLFIAQPLIVPSL